MFIEVDSGILGKLCHPVVPLSVNTLIYQQNQRYFPLRIHTATDVTEYSDYTKGHSGWNCPSRTPRDAPSLHYRCVHSRPHVILGYRLHSPILIYATQRRLSI